MHKLALTLTCLTQVHLWQGERSITESVRGIALAEGYRSPKMIASARSLKSQGQAEVDTESPKTPIEELAMFLMDFNLPAASKPLSLSADLALNRPTAHINRAPFMQLLRLRSAVHMASSFDVFSKPQPAIVKTGLPITGHIPAELVGGSYLRNGGNFARGESHSTLSFDGHGCIHRISLGAEHANYSSTFVRTDAWELEEELGRPVPRLSPRGIIEALRRNVRLGRANTNVLRWGTGLWATEESDAPVEVALEEGGVGMRTVRNEDGIGQEAAMRKLVSLLRAEKRAFTGHPTVVADGGPPLMVGYGYSHEARWPLCAYTVQGDDKEPSCRVLEGLLEGGLWSTGWQRPITVHNAAASRRSLFLPISIAPLGSPEWIHVPLPLSEDEPCKTLHCNQVRGFVGECIGAYYCTSTDEEEVLAFVHPPESAYGANLVRFRVRAGELIDEEVLWPDRLFMCGCAAPRATGEPPRFIFALGRSNAGVAAGRVGMTGIDVLVKLDLLSGEAFEIRATEGDEEVIFGDPCFIPAAEGSAEDHGFLLSLRSDGTTGTTALSIFDAQTFSAKPLATVELGVPIPHGAHSSFVPPTFGMLASSQ